MENQEQTNRYKELFNKYKFNIFFFGAVAILLFIVFSIVFISSNNKATKATITVPTPLPKPTYQQVVVSPTAIPNVTFSPQQQTLLENQTVPQIQQKTPANFSVTKVHPYTQDWAIMEISAPDADTAHVIVKRVNETWTIVLGPGTYFDPQQLQSVGAPQTLIDQVNALQ
ncbi:MAG: hypothetical protein ACREHC_05940 [Candidatus Levyibacteriota bacterium]